MKILAVFPEIITRGGCERSLLALMENFDMDILTNKFEPEKTYDGWKKLGDRIIEIKAKNKFWFGVEILKRNFPGYDIYYSHGYFITNLINIKNSPSVWYCHTPKRDLYPPTMKFHLEQMSPIKRAKFLAAAPFLRAADKFLAGRMAKIFSNSENVRSRVKADYGIDTKVVYSACIEKIQKTKFGGFYFYPGRIAAPKRIEIAIKAFEKMPDKKLVVAGSAVDENYLKFLKKIKPPNVEILTNLQEAEIKKLYSNCIATICLAENEDFGFIPPESFSFGKPCIAANEGGFMESVSNGKNGFLIEPAEASVMDTIKLNEKEFESMSGFCMETAKKFTKEAYIKNVKMVFESVLSK